MVSFLFGDRSHAIDEVERCSEIGERVGAGKVVTASDLPVGNLSFIFSNSSPCQRWNAPAAWNTMLFR